MKLTEYIKRLQELEKEGYGNYRVAYFEQHVSFDAENPYEDKDEDGEKVIYIN